jgi:hypothetical protein
VLFSDTKIAQFINDNFEPVWQSVRPVPTIQIDFGNGKSVKRTLHGNIATYVCTSSGVILDVLPGLYQPVAYLDALKQLSLLGRYVVKGGRLDQHLLASYHEKQWAALEHNRKPWRLVVAVDRANLWHIAFVPSRDVALKSVLNLEPTTECPNLGSADAISTWKALTTETTFNEVLRRKAIHERLVSAKLKPAQFTRWLYKDVLHADIDDPYLGLKDTLTATYPFKQADLR